MEDEMRKQIQHPPKSFTLALEEVRELLAEHLRTRPRCQVNTAPSNRRNESVSCYGFDLDDNAVSGGSLADQFEVSYALRRALTPPPDSIRVSGCSRSARLVGVEWDEDGDRKFVVEPGVEWQATLRHCSSFWDVTTYNMAEFAPSEFALRLMCAVQDAFTPQEVTA